MYYRDSSVSAGGILAWSALGLRVGLGSCQTGVFCYGTQLQGFASALFERWCWSKLLSPSAVGQEELPEALLVCAGWCEHVGAPTLLWRHGDKEGLSYLAQVRAEGGGCFAEIMLLAALHREEKAVFFFFLLQIKPCLHPSLLLNLRCCVGVWDGSLLPANVIAVLQGTSTLCGQVIFGG